jgi:Domain of unknown function (DUF4386)
MTERAVGRITAIAGITAVIVVIAGLATWGNPQYTDPVHITNSYYVGHRSEALLSVTLFLLLSLPVLVFGTGLRTLLRRREGEGDLLSTLTFGAAVANFVWLSLFGSVNAALALAAGQATPSAEKLLIALEFNVDQLNFLFMGALVGAASLSILLTRALPRWIGFVGAAAGILLLGSNVGMLDPTGQIGNVTNVGVIGQFGFLFWVLAVSVILIRRSTLPAKVASRATEPEKALG